MNSLYHIHAFVMVLWVLMAIVQPFLIKQKKTKLHRLIGKSSYYIMPVVFITTYLVIRHTYDTQISIKTTEATNETSALTNDQILTEAASYIVVGFIYFIWLVTFYLLAILNRKKMLFHATYMFAAILTILGPTVERLIYHVVTYFGAKYNFLAQNGVMLFIVLLLLSLTIYQKRKGNSVKPAIISMLIYIAGILAIFFLPNTHIWRLFIELIL